MSDEATDLRRLQDKVSYLDGMLQGTQHALQVVIAMALNPDATIHAIAEELERGQALGLGRPIDEPYLDGVSDTKARVLPSPRVLALFRK